MAGSEDIQVEIYEDFETITNLQQEWDEFVESVGSNIRLTYDWCRIWWKYYGHGRKPQILVFRKQARLVGIIPFFLEKLRLGPVSLRAGKIVGTDFSLAAFTPSIRLEFLEEVIKKFFANIFNCNRCDVFHFGPLSGTSLCFEDMLKSLQSCAHSGNKVTAKQITVQTYFKLAKSWEEHFASLPKKKQRDIKRKYRLLSERLNENDSLVAQFASKRDFEIFFHDFYEMHQSHWRRMNKNGHFEDWPRSKQFHMELAKQQLQHNRLRLLEVKAGSYILGYKYAYKFGDKYVEFLDARLDTKKFERMSLGDIVFCEQAKKAIEEGATYIDSLTGEYEHKRRMGGQIFPVRSIFICSRKPLDMARICIFKLIAKVLHICYYKIWFCRLAPRLPFKRRPLWKIWIRTNMFS